MISINTEFISNTAIMSARGLLKGGAVQKYINNRVLEYCEPYIPKRSGNLIRSGYATEDCVGWSASYAKTQYYTNKGNGLRGSRWFSRMWASRSAEIIKGARSVMIDSKQRDTIYKTVSVHKKWNLLRRLLRIKTA